MQVNKQITKQHRRNQMKFNKWTLGLAAVGVVSLTSAARADETKVSQLNTALSNTTISGYVDVSAQFNPNLGTDHGGGGAPNYYYGQPANSINMNVVDIAIDKPLDESPWASGYHIEFFVGPVAQAMGLNNDIRQAYITLRTPVGNGIDWKIGIFDTIVGYESTTSANNPNYSKSYGYNMEPTTHTGVLAMYKATDWLSAQIGIADESYSGNGGYTAASTSGLYHPTFMWGPTLTAPDSFGWAKGGTLSIATIITGNNTSNNGGQSPNYQGAGGQTFYAGITLPTPIAALKFGAAFDYLAAHDAAQNAWDAAIYSTYQFNDKLSLNLRAEYYDGKSLNTGEYGTGEGWTSVAANGYQEAQELTATVQYALWANVLTRLEVRWDHVNHGNGYDNNTENEGPGGGGYRQEAFMLAAQAIYTF
jgi:Putative beta-barrel porin-2, OmpL-like. bbp2